MTTFVLRVPTKNKNKHGPRQKQSDSTWLQILGRSKLRESNKVS